MATDSTPAIDSRPLLEQVVLLGLAELHREDETPVRTPEVRRICKTRCPTGETTVVGTIGEADVMRSLYRLEDDDLVDEIDAGRSSPTGKGRPAYTLAVDPETVSEGVGEELSGLMDS